MKVFNLYLPYSFKICYEIENFNDKKKRIRCKIKSKNIDVLYLKYISLNVFFKHINLFFPLKYLDFLLWLFLKFVRSYLYSQSFALVGLVLFWMCRLFFFLSLATTLKSSNLLTVAFVLTIFWRWFQERFWLFLLCFRQY